MRKLIFCLIIIISIANSLAQNEITCILGNPNIDECVKAAILDNFSTLHNPNKEAPFDTIDPFWFSYGQLIFDGTEKVQGNFTLKNITLIGANELALERIVVKSNDKIMKISGHMFVPSIQYEGFYDSNLKIEDFLVASTGSMNGTFEDVNGKFTLTGNFIDTDDGFIQLNATSFDILLVIKNMKFKINGLSKDEIMNTVINRVVNESWQLLYQDLVQAAKSLWESVVIDLMNELFAFVKFQN